MVVSCSHFIKCHYQYTIETVEKDVTVAALQARRETQMVMHSIVCTLRTVQTMVRRRRQIEKPAPALFVKNLHLILITGRRNGPHEGHMPQLRVAKRAAPLEPVREHAEELPQEHPVGHDGDVLLRPCP